MLRLTKIFYFEMAHAIYGYPGACKNIHGHSYELQVTVSSVHNYKNYIPAPGFVIDFKEIKKLVNTAVIEYFDHKMILSRNFLMENPSFSSLENLVAWEAEPTAENILLYIKQILNEKLPRELKLVQLKLYETKDSYAEWILEAV
ncbi:6-carboxytetrahydropterin synthase [Hydrotalea sp.]|uniref:6-pyruvoyl trahydropterin synthase family protein n=1 Tax=Hydrotalea sp. TaxID=2881279 RepID=UPI0026027FFB|nr:6-carboxytetrahydropterin synthase [Hydrotalea sp.]